MSVAPFVKASNTGVPVARSQAELERILRRYGASGFGVSTDYAAQIVKVHFRIPDSATVTDATAHLPIRLEVDIKAVALALYGAAGLKATKRWSRGRYVESDLGAKYEQAERVAWRHLVDWVDAACSAASAGLQKMSEAFLAHMLVKGDDGAVVRVIDQLNGRGQWRALLPAGEAK
jgi:hypothetical protein